MIIHDVMKKNESIRELNGKKKGQKKKTRVAPQKRKAYGFHKKELNY